MTDANNPPKPQGARLIDQIRASKLPSNMMQFAARGALQVPPDENIEILVHLAKHNKVFGELARMTLAGWDEKASIAAASNPQTPEEVLNYLISPDNVRPRLLAALLENPSIHEGQLVKLATSALRETIEVMLKSKRVHSMNRVVDALRSNPYLKKEEAEELRKLSMPVAEPSPVAPTAESSAPRADAVSSPVAASNAESAAAEPEESPETTFGEDDETVFAYLKENADDIAAEGEKPFITPLRSPALSGTGNVATVT